MSDRVVLSKGRKTLFLHSGRKGRFELTISTRVTAGDQDDPKIETRRE
jgi:hypothetical protein